MLVDASELPDAALPRTLCSCCLRMTTIQTCLVRVHQSSYYSTRQRHDHNEATRMAISSSAHLPTVAASSHPSYHVYHNRICFLVDDPLLLFFSCSCSWLHPSPPPRPNPLTCCCCQPTRPSTLLSTSHPCCLTSMYVPRRSYYDACVQRTRHHTPAHLLRRNARARVHVHGRTRDMRAHT